MISKRNSVALLVVFILLCLNFSVAQVDKDLDYKKFKKEFGREVNAQSDDTTSSGKFVLHPASIPGWFLSIPQSFSGTFYSVGISDPGLEEAIATEQATFRAKSLLALLIAPDVIRLADNYSNENAGDQKNSFRTKYISYFKIQSEIILDDSNIEIVEKFFTSFDEAMVLIKVNSAESGSEKIISEANVYQVERQKTNAFEIEEKYHIIGKMRRPPSDSSNFEYKMYSLNNIYEISSKLNNQNLEFPYLNYRYSTGNQPDTLKKHNSFSSKMNYGIWKSFLECFVHEVYHFSQDQPVKVKQVGDDYISRTQYLSREISIAKPALRIDRIECFNNHISVKLDQLN